MNLLKKKKTHVYLFCYLLTSIKNLHKHLNLHSNSYNNYNIYKYVFYILPKLKLIIKLPHYQLHYLQN